jgi:hypothetical protein
MAQLLGYGRELVDNVLDVLQGLLGPGRPRRRAVASGTVKAAGVILPRWARRVGVLDAVAGIHAGGLLEGNTDSGKRTNADLRRFLTK